MILYGKDLNARFRLKGADMFADAAAVADLLNNIWLLHRFHRAIQADDLDATGANRLFRDWAMFLADDTVNLPGKGEAVVFVEHPLTDYFAPFFLNGQ